MASSWIDTIERGVYKVRWRENGKKCSTGRIRSRIEAEDARRSIEERLRIAEKLRIYGQALPLEQIIMRWQATRQAQQRMGKGYAIECRRELMKMIAAMDWRTTADITQESVDRWRQARKKGQAAPLRYLKALLNWAHKSLKQPVAMLDMSLPRRKRAPRRLLDDGQCAVIEERAKERRQWPLVHCLMTYGWRPSSAARLRVGDVNLAAATVLLRDLKSGDALVHPIRAETVELLRPLMKGRASGDALFLAPLGGAWRIDNGTRAHQMAAWYRLDISAGFPADQRGIYDLKRYAITNLLRAAHGDPAAVATITGHRSLSQVLVYARTNLEAARAVVDHL